MLCPRCARSIPDDAALCCYCAYKILRGSSRRSRANGMGSAYRRGKTWTAVYVRGWKKINDRLVPDKATKGGFETKKEALEYIPSLKAGK